MKIRTSERYHQFSAELYSALGAYSLQGLMMDAHHRWTCALEAIEFDNNESVCIEKSFPEEEVLAKLCLAEALGIPLFFVAYRNGRYLLFDIRRSTNSIVYEQINEFDETGFVNWWRTIKGTAQTKGFNNGAESMVEKTIFDSVLEKHNLSWGGNIDGFIIRDGKPICIIDNIYSRKHPIDTPKSDPAKYFFKKGPNYNTWYSTVKLACDLQHPHLLFTFDRNSDQERIGLTTIHHLNTKGIFYVNDIAPYAHLVEGEDCIIADVLSRLSAPPPYIE